MLFTYFLNNLETVPVAPVISGVTFVYTFHMRRMSIVRSLQLVVIIIIIIITTIIITIITHFDGRKM
jgi:hypothetical protein